MKRKRTSIETAKRYAEWCRRGTPDPDPDPLYGAWLSVTKLTEDDPEEAWRTLLDAVAQMDVSEELALDQLGADALESLLAHHGDAFLDRAEQAAREDRRVCLALRGVWLFDSPIRPRLNALLTECDARPAWLS